MQFLLPDTVPILLDNGYLEQIGHGLGEISSNKRLGRGFRRTGTRCRGSFQARNSGWRGLDKNGALIIPSGDSEATFAYFGLRMPRLPICSTDGIRDGDQFRVTASDEEGC